MAGYPKSHVILTDKLKPWIRTVLLNANLPQETREELRKYTSGRRNHDDKKQRTIPFELVKTVHKYLQDEQGGLYLHELLEGSDISLHETELPPRNPELEARVQKLRTEYENKQYEEMTRNVGSKKHAASESPGVQVKQLNNQLIAVVNFLITVIGAFAFTYKATEYAMETPNLAVQVMSGLIIATIVFFADLYFLIKYTV